ncbi:MAG: DUF1616 domain-containing protein [Chloroflexi bacterium]|nr:DUF1616 domain-containing protein [Chloroflexota bacterium]
MAPPRISYLNDNDVTEVKSRSVSGVNLLLFLLLALILLGSLGTVLYIMTEPRVVEPYTEFYLLGSGGRADDYPSSLRVGDEATVTVGIINREQRHTDYGLSVTIDGKAVSEPERISLGVLEEYKAPLKFRPFSAGEGKEVKFILYKDGDTVPYLELHLRIDVRAT